MLKSGVAGTVGLDAQGQILEALQLEQMAHSGKSSRLGLRPRSVGQAGKPELTPRFDARCAPRQCSRCRSKRRWSP